MYLEKSLHIIITGECILPAGCLVSCICMDKLHTRLPDNRLIGVRSWVRLQERRGRNDPGIRPGDRGMAGGAGGVVDCGG